MWNQSNRAPKFNKCTGWHHGVCTCNDRSAIPIGGPGQGWKSVCSLLARGHPRMRLPCNWQHFRARHLIHSHCGLHPVRSLFFISMLSLVFGQLPGLHQGLHATNMTEGHHVSRQNDFVDFVLRCPIKLLRFIFNHYYVSEGSLYDHCL